MRIRTVITINDSFRELIKSHNYEKYVWSIINSSKEIFPDFRFTHIEDQAHGESDFLDQFGKRYDAKLVFDQDQGRLIGDSRNDLLNWVNDMLNEKTEFSEIIDNRSITMVESTKLYGIMKARLNSVKDDENAILFIPFPIVDDIKGSVFLFLVTDFLQAVYDRLAENGYIGNREVYFIYPSMMPHEYVLRDSKRKREFITCRDLECFILYESVVGTDE